MVEEDERVSALVEGLRLDDVKNGTTFQVDLADVSAEIEGQEIFGECFDDEESVSQFYFGLPPVVAAKHHDNWRNKTFSELEGSMRPLTAEKGVFKRDVKAGHGIIVPEKAMVTVHYNSFLEKCPEPFDSTKFRGTPDKFMLGESKVLLGFDMAISSMRKNEISEFLIKPEFAFGKTGCPPRIPANQSIFYTIELVSFISFDGAIDFENTNQQTKSSFMQTLGFCMAENLAGNDLYREKQYTKAVARYRGAINRLSRQNLANEDEEKKCNKELLILYLNASQCYLDIGEPKSAEFNAKRALEFDGNNTKALFRCGKALRIQGEFKKARRYLQRVYTINPNDTKVIIELKELERKERLLNTEEKEFCMRMFGNGANNVASTSIESSEKPTFDLNPEFKKNMIEILEEFKTEDQNQKLPFSTGFTQTDIAFISQAAIEMGLECIYPDNGENQLMIIKKTSD